jgi:hypothetical protein
LFFALTLHSLVTRLPSSLHLNCWYLDDGHLVGTAEDLALAATILTTEGPALGLHLNLSKRTLWGPGLSPNATLLPSPP